MADDRLLPDAVLSAALTAAGLSAALGAAGPPGSQLHVSELPGGSTSVTAPPGMFQAEAAGLAVLRRRGGLRTPAVLASGPDWLLLEALHPCADEPGFWEAAGRSIARLHQVQGQRFGWDQDGWLGRLTQRNDWQDDGHEFFAANRILRYLSEPRVEASLDATTRAAVERLCSRLPELIPAALPVLTHGDLWSSNMLATDCAEPAFIDPAVCWMWAETDLSMIYCTPPGVPGRFFDAYQELAPSEPGWRERMPILHMRELLCVLAHYGPNALALEALTRIIHPFRPA
jgi:fructosamine-3-kinase